MITKKFIDYLAAELQLTSPELLEKDLLLQSLLIGLAQLPRFKDDFAFKGGTCLIKCYLGYYRFSEDLDFTYLQPEEFAGKSEKEIRKLLSMKINDLLLLLQRLAERYQLDFQADKQNRKYVELGGSNKLATFKIWYDSVITGRSSFIKIQVNFVEKLFYTIRLSAVPGLIPKEKATEVEFLFPEYRYLFDVPSLRVYDLQEILVEKVRAILTRKGLKARDFLDVFAIVKETGQDLLPVQRQIIAKITFMLSYSKYLQNLTTKREQLDKKIILAEEPKLLLRPLPGFEAFLGDFIPFLHKVIEMVPPRR